MLLAVRMSFFGITTLGPPNIFQLYRHQEISAISKEDFFVAFRMVAGGAGTITKDQIKDVMHEVGAPTEGEDFDKFSSFFDNHDAFNLESFEDALDDFMANNPTKPAKQYVSSSKLKEDRLKHKRCEGSSAQKYHVPLTSSQEYGWGNPTDNIKRALPPCGKMFAHRPSHMSYYAECMICYEEGRDLSAGPTLKAMEL